MKKMSLLIFLIIFSLFFSTSCVGLLSEVRLAEFSKAQTYKSEQIINEESSSAENSNLENIENIPIDEFDSCTGSLQVTFKVIDIVEVKDE
jgi:hypothetical protein